MSRQKRGNFISRAIEEIKKPLWWLSAIVLIIVGLFFGSFFAIFMNYQIGNTSSGSLENIEAVYKNYRETYAKNSTECILYFEDAEPMYINRACYNRTIGEKLDEIEPGTKMIILLKNGRLILDLKVNSESLLEYEHSMQLIKREGVGWTIMGLVCYSFAAFAIIKIIRKDVYPEDFFQIVYDEESEE